MRIWFGDRSDAPEGWVTLRAVWQIQEAVRHGLVSVLSVPSTPEAEDLHWWLVGAAALGELDVVPVVEVRT